MLKKEKKAIKLEKQTCRKRVDERQHRSERQRVVLTTASQKKLRIVKTNCKLKGLFGWD